MYTFAAESAPAPGPIKRLLILVNLQITSFTQDHTVFSTCPQAPSWNSHVSDRYFLICRSPTDVLHLAWQQCILDGYLPVTLKAHVCQKSFSDPGYEPNLEGFLGNVGMLRTVIWRFAPLHNQNTKLVEKNRLYITYSPIPLLIALITCPSLTRIPQFLNFHYQYLYEALYSTAVQNKWQGAPV